MKTTFFRRLGRHFKNFFTQQQNAPVKDASAMLAGAIGYVAALAGLPMDPTTAAVLAGFLMRSIAGIGPKPPA